jgi:hypothetical protein
VLTIITASRISYTYASMKVTANCMQAKTRRTTWRGGPEDEVLLAGTAAAKLFITKKDTEPAAYRQQIKYKLDPNTVDSVTAHNPTYLYPLYANKSKYGKVDCIMFRPNFIAPASHNSTNTQLQIAWISISGAKLLFVPLI